MSLKRIEDWDDILESLQLPLNKPAEPFKKLDRIATSEAALNGENWHDNVLRLVASWVATGQTDYEILTKAEHYTLSGYTVDQTKDDIQRMVDSARHKGFAKSGEILQQSSYMYHHNQIYLMKVSRTGPKEIRLTNFDAEIIYETTLTNGMDNSKTFTVEGVLHNGTLLSKLDVEANAFDKLEWLPTNWGAKAQVTVGSMYKAHVAAAIKERSDPTERTVYSHTGWIDKNGKFCYLTKRGGISAAGLNEEIETELRGYEKQLEKTSKKDLAARKHVNDKIKETKTRLDEEKAGLKTVTKERKRANESMKEAEENAADYGGVLGMIDSKTGGLISSIGGMTKSVSSATKGFGAMRIAIIGTGIGALLIALTSLFFSLNIFNF
jgi:hypothetical protein